MAINRDIYEVARTDAYYLTVKGARHRNFSNLNLLFALDRDRTILGEISAGNESKK